MRPMMPRLRKWRRVGPRSAQAKQTANVAERTKLYEKAQEVFKREAPWVTMAHSVVVQPMLKNVEGYKMSPFGSVQFYGVSVK